MINTNYEKLLGLLKTNFCYSTQTLRMQNIKKKTQKNKVTIWSSFNIKKFTPQKPKTCNFISPFQSLITGLAKERQTDSY